MDILKTSIDWAKAEMFSTTFFIIIGVLFVAASLGFWQLGKTDLARAYIIPALVSGILLMTIGLGLFFNNKARVTNFEKEYNEDATAFYESEVNRVNATLKEYKTVLIVVPLIIVAAALVIIFINTPLWRAIEITTIAMVSTILIIDGMAHARIDVYKQQLELFEKQE